jgi:hypothetical protein
MNTVIDTPSATQACQVSSVPAVMDSKKTAIVSGDLFPFGNSRIHQSEALIEKEGEYVFWCAFSEEKEGMCQVY